MHRYISLLWDPTQDSAAQEADKIAVLLQANSSTWVRKLQGAGAYFFEIPSDHAALTTHILPNAAGVILGNLFPKGSVDAEVETITEYRSTRIVSTLGRSLVDDYWGSYVAFFYSKDQGRRVALRDCSGKIPCYMAHSSGVDIFFADIEDLLNLRVLQMSINWTYLAAFLCSSEFQVTASGLNEISELLAGHCIETSNGVRKQTSIWDPRAICREAVIEDYEDASLQLRKACQQSVSGWADIHQSILLSLSGGFDSAVVLGCLAKVEAPIKVTCLNRFSDTPGEDERSYARLAAERARVSLIESEWNLGKIGLEEFSKLSPRSPKPSLPTLFGMSELQVRNQVARKVGAQAMWTGQGGDHLFYQMTTNLGAADFLNVQGVRFGLLKAVADAARFTREPYWNVLRSAWSTRRGGHAWRPDDLSDYRSFFVHPDAAPSDLPAYTAHPWTIDSEDLPLGKQLQIFYLAEVVNRHRAIGNLEVIEEWHPLLSQPMMTTCLRIPTYLLLRGGRQRSLARDAFREYLPAAIVGREDKGATTSRIIEVVRQSRPYICEMLFEGLLMKQGLLDRKVLEPHLRDRHPIRAEQFFPLMACICAEIWTRRWMGDSVHAAD